MRPRAAHTQIGIMRQSGRPPFSDSSPRAPQRVRDHLRPPEHRGRPLGVLAQTVMSLRAILARRFAPPAPPAQRDYALSRRATPSWMADALVRPTAPEPGPAPAAPPGPWTQSPFAPPAHPAPRPARAASFAPQADAFSPESFSPEPLSPEPWVPTPAPVPAEAPRPVATRPVQLREQEAHGYGPAASPGAPARSPAPPRAADAFVAPATPAPVESFLPDEPEGLAPPAVMVAPEPAAPRRASTWAPDPALVPDGGWAMPIPPAGPARAVLTRARRRDAEPDAPCEPEARARPVPERAPEAGVRFTRTPDHVLQMRQRRREQAVREREEAQRAAQAEAEARAAAELAAAEAAQAEAEAARIEAEAAAAAAAVPIWRQPFVLPPGVRFTRTPDHLLRHPAEEVAPAESAPTEPAPQAAVGDTESVPAAEPIAAATAEPFADLDAPEPSAGASPVADPSGVVPEAAFVAAPISVEPARFECAQVETAAVRPVVFGPAPLFGPATLFGPLPEPAPGSVAAMPEVLPPVPDLVVAPADAAAAPAVTFDVPDAAILVPVDVSHLRSLPPRPVYALDRLLQHDWTHPLSTAEEQDNRPLPEPEPETVEAVVPETTVSAPVADLVTEVAASAMPAPAAEPDSVPAQDVAQVEAVAQVEGVAEVRDIAEVEESAPIHAGPAVEAVEAHGTFPPATILLPAPAPMLALTYAPLADAILLPAPAEPAFVAPSLPALAVEVAPVVADELSASEPVVGGFAAIDSAVPAFMPASLTATGFAATSFSFAPVPWSFIAADAQPLGSAIPSEPSPVASAPAEPTPAAAPQLGQPFVYVPTGRQNGQPPAPTLPSPPRPPRIILPVAVQQEPVAAPQEPVAPQQGPIATQPEPGLAQPETFAAPVMPTAAGFAPQPAPSDGIAFNPYAEPYAAAASAWSPTPSEPQGLVIGTTGLAVDLGLDADDDGEDEDDILAPVATIPLRQAARFEVPYELPSVDLLAEPRESDGSNLDPEMLEDNALQLQQVIQDFGVRGEILAVRPGPVVTLYEMEPAPGTKSSRVISLADDIARSMSAISARVAVVQGRNAIGIELPNLKRETVYLRELLTSPVFTETKQKLALCLGKNIGGEAIIADLARMPHLLVAGTTGSGKSVAINTMILSLLYRMTPEECRLIMVDPKMLELSVYDGIPHLLSPVVTDPKKAVIALKWAVREMEERYKKMSKISVRNIDGYNARMKEARERGEIITRTVQTGFDRTTGEAVFEEQEMDLSALPYIVIVVDEMADLMMVAGKDIEGAIQRLAQMARAAGIHLIMATQRPSVDVITGTIKANFPTRISFQVTSKIDSRTILGEMGAEQLLGQGDMLFMAGGGRTTRVHGPFCSDDEVEQVVAHLKRQGRPSYLEAVTADEEAEEAAAAAAQDTPVMDQGSFGDPTADLYDQAVAVVLRDKKASTSYIQRRLQIGYNRAASLMERMEREGIVGPANHAGKREILIEPAPQPGSDEA